MIEKTEKDSRFVKYAGMVAAAGAATVAGSGDAEAEILYSGLLNFDVTAALDAYIDIDGNLISEGVGTDGTDLLLQNFALGGGRITQLRNSANSGVTGDVSVYASAFADIASGVLVLGNLDAGTEIGPAIPTLVGEAADPFTPSFVNDAASYDPELNYYYNADGSNQAPDEFSNGASGFVGFSIQLDTGLHYGWLQLAGVTANPDGNDVFATIVDFAYESTPDVSILAGATSDTIIPEPGSLALLAAGAAGLVTRRKRVADRLSA